MKYKLPLFFLTVLAAFILLFNSCKKDNQGSIHTLFTGNSWQLASVMRFHFVGDTLKTTDTLNTLCLNTQIFTFNTDNSCTYTNFDCKVQPVASGHWSLSSNQLFLMADVTCQDTTKGISTSQPFLNSKILNLGQYSLILRTGSLETFYPPKQVRVYTEYGFVRVKSQ